jgi:hypothetical protein
MRRVIAAVVFSPAPWRRLHSHFSRGIAGWKMACVVGKVSGLSRDSRGHVERIRVVGPMLMGFGQRTLIIRDTYFKVEEHAVQIKLKRWGAERDAASHDWG